MTEKSDMAALGGAAAFRALRGDDPTSPKTRRNPLLAGITSKTGAPSGPTSNDKKDSLTASSHAPSSPVAPATAASSAPAINTTPKPTPAPVSVNGGGTPDQISPTPPAPSSTPAQSSQGPSTPSASDSASASEVCNRVVALLDGRVHAVFSLTPILAV